MKHPTSEQGRSDFGGSSPDVAIIGAGMAGLATAVRTKEGRPDLDVVVIEKRAPQSNTQISGQRYRAGKNHQRLDGPREIAELMGARNQGVITPEMITFGEIGCREIDTWTKRFCVPMTDSQEWFGPQFGDPTRRTGFGKQVLEYMKHVALRMGVEFIVGESVGLVSDDDTVSAIELTGGRHTQILGATAVVIANGSAGGNLFLSTNKTISHSAPELALKAGLPLVGSTINMLHPFGRCDTSGRPRVGCFETDKLSDADVYFGIEGDTLDKTTTALLRDHAAHQSMRDIARRFQEHGSIVTLKYPDGSADIARVSHHYSHMGIKTTDGVRVDGMRNLFAVGDASDIGRWTAYNERLPGVALTKCLVDAALVADALQSLQPSVIRRKLYRAVSTVNQEGYTPYDAHVRNINTASMIAWNLSDTDEARMQISDQWRSRLDQAEVPTSDFMTLSKKVAAAHMLASQGVKEPIIINELG